MSTGTSPLLAEFFIDITIEGDLNIDLSYIVADHPLRPATRHRLGRLLPHQQADRTQAHLQAVSYDLCSYEIMQDCPAFRRVILHSEVDSHALLTRLPRQTLAGLSFDLHA